MPHPTGDTLPKPLEDDDPNWLLEGGYLSWELWQLWEASNYVALPYAGGMLDQPDWVRRDFLMIDQQQAHFAFWARQKADRNRGKQS